MAIEYNKESNLFQVDYQAPFGGLDSSAFASAINPANFADMDAIYINNNEILPVILENLGTVNGGSLVGGYMGFLPIDRVTNSNYLIGYVVTDQAIYNAFYLPGGSVNLILAGNYSPAASGGPVGFSYIAIDQIQRGTSNYYFTTPGWTEVWMFDSDALTITLVTNYIGGGVLALLQNQLLVLGGTSALDGPVPNRISWSAPGAYGNFVPYDVGTGTGDYSAGFNDLPSVSDVLTGFATIGTVGYLFRTQGITQVNPTGNGIEPFQFNHLWASELGIGNPYPGAVAQYGSVVAFVTDVGVYALSIGGLTELGKSARSYLYRLLNSQFAGAGASLLQARIMPYILDSPELIYVLAIPTLISGQNFWYFIAIDMINGQVLNMGAQLAKGSFASNLQLSFVSSYVFLTPINSELATRQLNVLAVSQGTSGIQFSTITQGTDNVGTIVFRKEQLKFGYVPTVTKVAVIGALIDTTIDGSIFASIDGGLSYPFSKVITAGVAPGGDGVLDNIYLDEVQSIQRPQLRLQLTNVKIVEAWYQGTLADFELI